MNTKLILAGMMLSLSLAACGNREEAPADTAAPAADSGTGMGTDSATAPAGDATSTAPADTMGTDAGGVTDTPPATTDGTTTDGAGSTTEPAPAQ